MTYADLLLRYRKKHGKLVAPDSLQPALHLAFSMGMKRGFTNLGTYANKPGDHGYYPSWAFDLGRKNRFFFKGWDYLVARRFALFLWENHLALHIEYVILGRRIISRSRPYWHALNDPHDPTPDTSHDFHIHVSGHH
jgi:hypothetical protein